MQKSCLIIFAKNLVPGKVKTRLAATIGAEQAMKIYKELLAHTYGVTKALSFHKIVYYSEYLEYEDLWNEDYDKGVQEGNELGERMTNAFNEVFQKEFDKAVIIGTDCPGLTTSILNDAFKNLDKYDVVIGPATDGGYYLLGMKRYHPLLFKNIAWSTATVCDATKTACDKLQLQYYCLPMLNDVDEEKDLQYLNHTTHG
jgi:rSAM/selenodomain-associated transferase 1